MNSSLNNAKRSKNDEFYTQYADIEKEVNNYWEQLKDKIVYCNTDNYKESNFVKYFVDNFEKIQLKKLISLDLDGNYFEYDGEVKQYSKFENGDFRSEESKELLKEADIVCTNPPFSLFREYMAQLMEYDKDFLIIGNQNAITYKEVFPLLKDNKFWLGYNSGAFKFEVPDFYDKKNIEIGEDGKKYAKLGNITWFTNLDVKKRHEKLILYKTYNPEEYPKYDNYDAIEVNRVANIPVDYDGIMGVPITFMDKYNPEQFEILGSRRWAKSQELLDVYCGDKMPPESDKKTTISGKETYDRIFIKRKNKRYFFCNLA